MLDENVSVDRQVGVGDDCTIRPPNLDTVHSVRVAESKVLTGCMLRHGVHVLDLSGPGGVSSGEIDSGAVGLPIGGPVSQLNAYP